MADTAINTLGLPVPAVPDFDLDIMEQGGAGATRGREIIAQLPYSGLVQTQGEVTLGTASGVIVVANPKRVVLYLMSEASAGNNIRIAAGMAATVSHWPLWPGNMWTDNQSVDAWNGIASAAGQVIRYLEWSRA